jgi:eukaryotic-like serine/threonine-protein kinase
VPDDPCVERLIEEMLDSGSSAEEVCRDAPELLHRVREGWRRFRALEARIDELFPEPGSVADREATLPDDDLPRAPGYELIGVLGRGGVGVIYKAVHLRLNRTVALKMPLAGAFATRAERQRFAREAELVAGLRHPNVVQVYDVGDLDGRPYFTMEFVEGGSLAEAIAGTPRPARQAAELVATLADAIAAAHRGGVVHRDLKPSNVLLTADGTPKVTDFGLARHLEVGSSLTQTGAAVGTPSYMAPEQARGRTGEVGPASDLYALGAVLYELLTGRPPFRAESTAATVHQVITQDPVPPSRLNAKVPRDLETICLKCLRKDPRLRYADADALAEDLRRFLRGEAIAARPENGLQRMARRVRRRPALSATIAAGALLALSMAGVGLWLILDRAETAHKAEGERAAIEDAAAGDLDEMERLLGASDWPQAAAALERAKARLGDRGPARLRRRLDQGARDLELAASLDAIRLDRITRREPEGRAAARSDGEYEAAFVRAGLGRVHDAPEMVAAKVNASKIRGALVDTIDDWAYWAHEAGRRTWLLSVARLADPDPTGWRDRARDPANYQDRSTLEALIAGGPVADPCVPLFLSLAKRASAAGVDPVPFLKKVQQAHPGNLYANLMLAEKLRDKDPGEAIRYYQAALAIRPGAGIIRNNFGVALSRNKRDEEAVDQYRKAVELDPADPQSRRNLAVTLHLVGRHDEAIETFPAVLRDSPEDAAVHCIFGVSLDARGRSSEAVEEFRKAATLDPKLKQARSGLWKGLLRVGREDEARVVWGETLADGPPEHDLWHGYPELCLFLGQEEEYGRIRSASLARFGTSSNPHVAACIARSCLLRPASDEEMRRILALAATAWGVNPLKHLADYPQFQFLRGLAEYRQGRLDQAIAIMRGNAAHQVLGPSPRLVLAMALHRSGKVEEARKTLAAAVAGYSWRAAGARDQSGWIYHILRREAEGLILPDLPAFVEGTYQPRDNDERFALLGACWFAERAAAAARLYADAYSADPQLADDPVAGHRYDAACAAALAGGGLGNDGGGLGPEERTRWRKQARSWLGLELAALARRLDGGRDADRHLVRTTLSHWLADPDLAGVREPGSLSPLSVEERDGWLAFWKEVNALLNRATGG